MKCDYCGRPILAPAGWILARASIAESRVMDICCNCVLDVIGNKGVYRFERCSHLVEMAPHPLEPEPHFRSR